MEVKDYSIEKVFDLISDLKNLESINEVNPSNLVKAMQFLTYQEDEDNFKQVVDEYVALAERTIEKSDVKENPRGFLEYLCAGVDRSFTMVGYSAYLGKKVEPGQFQSFFRNLYGTHF